MLRVWLVVPTILASSDNQHGRRRISEAGRTAVPTSDSSRSGAAINGSRGGDALVCYARPADRAGRIRPVFQILDEYVTEAEELVAKLAEFRGDPIGFVQWAFPWGQDELAGYDGPFEWQQRVLEAIKDGLPLDRAIRV